MKSWQIFIALFALAAISSRGQAPLPDPISIDLPSSAVSSQAAAFLGAWLGAWDLELPTALIVEHISSNGVAKVIYSWGDSPMHQFTAGWIRQTGHISNGNLRFTAKSGHQINFTFEPDGTLLGRYEATNTPPSFVTLYRVLSTNTVLIRAAAEKVTGVRQIQVHDHGLRGTLFLPAGKGPWPGIIVLGGSEGGLPYPPGAAFLAAKGYAAFALAYFRYEDLPKSLENILLEYFQTAIQWLQARDDIRRNSIAVMGGSRGGELALLLGATFPEIHAVVAISASSVLWEGLGQADDQPAWIWQGKPLPFMEDVKLTHDERREFTQLSRTNSEAWFLIHLDNKAEVARASIPVEKINGPVLLISGEEDKLWPSTQMEDMIMKRFKEARHPFPDRHLAYPGVGHIIPVPNAPTTSDFIVSLGGDPKHIAAAAADAWPQIVNFLNQSLKLDRH